MTAFKYSMLVHGHSSLLFTKGILAFHLSHIMRVMGAPLDITKAFIFSN